MIYLDYSATTPVDPEVIKSMKPFFSDHFANSASVHTPGQTALKAVDDARYLIADKLKTKGNNLIFTSGATEANNLALFGIANNYTFKNVHIITTKIEHASILEPCHYLEKRGVKITYLPVDHTGLIKPDDVIAHIRPETRLISIGYVNSETGLIQPIKKIGRLISNYNKKRYTEWLNTPTRRRGVKPIPILFHTDATQALNFLDCAPRSLHVDLMSLSAHKIYGPKGIGLLYCHSDIKLTPLLYGGHQERNIRSGTVNVPAVVGFATAFKALSHQQKKISKHIANLRTLLLKNLKKELPKLIINTQLENSIPSVLSLSFPSLEGDLLQALLDKQGVAVSTGSACASGDITTSHVLQAMGKSELVARGAIRLSLGKQTTLKEIKIVTKILPATIKKLLASSHSVTG